MYLDTKKNHSPDYSPSTGRNNKEGYVLFMKCEVISGEGRRQDHLSQRTHKEQSPEENKEVI